MQSWESLNIEVIPFKAWGSYQNHIWVEIQGFVFDMGASSARPELGPKIVFYTILINIFGILI